MRETESATEETSLADGPVPRSKADVLQMYKDAVDLVKLRCPGFVRKVDNHASDFHSIQSENGLFDAAQKILLANDQSADETVTVQKEDDLACRTYFPIYHTDYGCLLQDTNIVKSAVCYAQGDNYNILILFEEQTDPDPTDSAFAAIMVPYTKETMLTALNAYLPVLNNKNTTTASFRYYNCEIRCTVERSTGRMVSLSHKVIADVSLQVAVDMVFTDLDEQIACTLIQHTDYNSFVW